METLTATELADIFWNGTSKWPSGDSSWAEELRSSTKLAPDDFRHEMIYLLAFVSDFTFHVALKEASPAIRNAVRDAYGAHLRSFVQQVACKPMPEGEWMGESMLYLTTGEYPKASINNDPVRNLDDRFQLFSEALRRGGKDRSVGECLGKTFAGLCGTVDVSFIVGVSTMVTKRLSGHMDLVRPYAHEIRPG